MEAQAEKEAPVKRLMTPEEWANYCATIDAVTKRLTGATLLFGHEASVMLEIEATEPIWFEKCQGAEGPCESEYAYRRSQNTRYTEPGRNIVTLCDECMAVNDSYWEERWNEYYSGRL